MGKYNRLPSLEFSKLCLLVEAKLVALSDVVLNVWRSNIKDNYVLVSYISIKLANNFDKTGKKEN